VRRRTSGKRSDKPKRPVGRPRKARAGAAHKKRPVLKARFPVHVVLRVARDVGSLRKRDLYKAFREATLTVLRRELNVAETGAFRIVHLSIQRTHVHLLVEADHRMALSRGMQSFQISAAKHVNRVVGLRRGERRRGAVFPDRFFQEIITSPRQARRTLSYVLNNWRKHREDRVDEVAHTWKVDPFSTGVFFHGWKEREGNPFVWRWRATYEPCAVYLPRTWLLVEGWKRAGLISCYEIPSGSR
jgi:REP element-mobilizing transposase RayT